MCWEIVFPLRRMREKNLHEKNSSFAQMIQKTGGELFSIKTNSTYPVDYEQLIEQGEKEKGEKYRPELASHVEDMEKYEIIFLGYPNC